MSDSLNLQNKKTLYKGLYKLVEEGSDNLKDNISDLYHADAEWRGSHPLNEMNGTDAIFENVWQPLLNAMPDLERRDVIFMGGEFEGRHYVGAVGHLLGTFKNPWLDLLPNNAAMYLRYGEYHEVVDGKIKQSNVIFDILDFIRQCDLWPLAPMQGSPEMWPGPITADGVLLTEQDPKESQASIDLVLAMHKVINTFPDSPENTKRDVLLTMEQKKYWHPKMMWYGPAGIGTARGLAGYVDNHQLPFRLAFPNREAVGHYVRFGDGKYGATGGWPSVAAVHTGGNWCGLPITGKKFTMRVMDFYLNEGDLIRENWIPLDMLDFLMQIGYDVFARLKTLGKGVVKS